MNARQKSILVGAIFGGAVGALGGYLFSRGLQSPEAEEMEPLSLKAVPPGEIIRFIVSIMALLRSISEMGERV